jgi:hypothetical protein
MHDPAANEEFARSHGGVTLNDLNLEWLLVQQNVLRIRVLEEPLRGMILAIMAKVIARDTARWTRKQGGTYRGKRYEYPMMEVQEPPDPKRYDPLTQVYSVTWVSEPDEDSRLHVVSCPGAARRILAGI